MSTRILLADEMVMLRQGLRTLLEREGLTVVAETADPLEVVELVSKHRPDVTILAVMMPRINVLQVVRELQRTCPAVRVILLGTQHDDRIILEALQEGARGFVAKTQSIEELLQAIRDVERGDIYVGSNVSKAILLAGIAAPNTRRGRLSPRERDVLELVAEGKSTKQIAAFLNIRFRTARFHRTRLMKKLDIHEAAGLVRYAIRQGLIGP